MRKAGQYLNKYKILLIYPKLVFWKILTGFLIIHIAPTPPPRKGAASFALKPVTAKEVTIVVAGNQWLNMIRGCLSLD